MVPHSVADFLLDEDDFIDSSIRELYPENMLVFFEVGEVTYLTLDLEQEQEDGICPVYYFDKKIATSLEEFLKRMDEETDYYIYVSLDLFSEVQDNVNFEHDLDWLYAFQGFLFKQQ